jgi:hypothetical protein
MSYGKRNISIDNDVWLRSKTLIKEEMNLTMSKFIELQLRTLLRGRTGTFQDVVMGAAKDFIEADKSLTREERMKMDGLFDQKKKPEKVKKKKSK